MVGRKKRKMDGSCEEWYYRYLLLGGETEWGNRKEEVNNAVWKSINTRLLGHKSLVKPKWKEEFNESYTELDLISNMCTKY